MTGLPHSIIIDITPEGQIKSTVKGVKGPACGKLTEWLDQLGKVETTTPTPEYYQAAQAQVLIKK